MRSIFAAQILVVLTATRMAAAVPVTVTFQINDSYVKGKTIADVSIGVALSEDGPFVASGTTDTRGRLELSLEPGEYFATYRAPSYVPIEKSPVRVGSTPLTITTTLTMMMEATGTVGRARVQVVLNWGSREGDQVQDIDAHLLCACKAAGAHVFYGALRHGGEGHECALDVDDRDWGGPETVTLTDPVPGSYSYWVYDYSGSDGARLGNSDVVVRVVIDDSVAGEYRIPADVVQRAWRPFRELTVGSSGEPRIVPFTAEDRAAGMDRRIPPERDWPPASSPAEGTSSPAFSIGSGWVFGLLVLVAFILLVRWRRRQRRIR